MAGVAGAERKGAVVRTAARLPIATKGDRMSFDPQNGALVPGVVGTGTMGVASPRSRLRPASMFWLHDAREGAAGEAVAAVADTEGV